MAGDFIRDPGVQKWINIFGDVQIIEGLARLENKLQRKVVKDAIRKGLVPIRAMARRNAPRGDHGLLKKSIKSTVTRMVSGKVYVDPAVVMIDGQRVRWKRARGMTKKQAAAARREHLDAARAAGSEIIRPANYAHLVELGTKYAPKGQMTTNPYGPKRIRSRAHAPTSAQPFMRPALEQSRSQVLRIISDEVAKALAELERGMQ